MLLDPVICVQLTNNVENVLSQTGQSQLVLISIGLLLIYNVQETLILLSKSKESKKYASTSSGLKGKLKQTKLS
jgi:hypothetical protein